ncbi:MAG: nitrite reductase, copper-containing [Dehalococcoidia bacterium]|nr:nitrite reductase, copper-containing [Dehalococcoidia bacterium]
MPSLHLLSLSVVLSVAFAGAACNQADPSAATSPSGRPAVAEPIVAALGQPPAAAPAVNRKQAATVKVQLETTEQEGQLADGVRYKFWTFNGTVPGPMVRVRQGDMVELTLKNAPTSRFPHSIDLHAVTSPGGGAVATQTSPGGETRFSFKALNPGVYVYHCATPSVPEHIANGMYGLIVVEPEGGLPKVDREFYVMQGDFYTAGKLNEPGLQAFSHEKMLNETPEYVVFNGSTTGVGGAKSLKAKVGETVRIFFGVGGPNLASSFHVIGEIFDRVYPEGASEALRNVQRTLVPTGGATIVDFKLEVPGNYTLVDHSLSRVLRGAAGTLEVSAEPVPSIFSPGGPVSSAGH